MKPLVYSVGFLVGVAAWGLLVALVRRQAWHPMVRWLTMGLAGLTLTVLVQIGAFDRLAHRLHLWMNLDGKHHVTAQALSRPIR
jgi:uncharacterized membrane protein YedE/YeeE